MGKYLEQVTRNIREKRELSTDFYNNLDPAEKLVHKSRQYFVIDNISIYIIVSICAGSYLAGLLKYAGVSAQLNGMILSLPVLAGIFQLIGAVISQKLHTQRIFILTGVTVHRICLSILFLYPLLLGPTKLCIVMIVITYATGFFVGTAVGPAAGNWLICLVPQNIRGSYFSRREKFSLFGVAAATLIVSVILDKAKAMEAIAWGFAVVGVLLLTVAAVDIAHMAKIHEPALSCSGNSIKLTTFLEPLRNIKFLKIIFVFVLWQATTQIAIPFMGIYYIENIKMNYTMIGTVSLIVTLEKALIVGWWGKYADRTSWDHVLKVAIGIFSFSQAMQVFLSASNAIWLYPLAQLIGNIAWSVFGIAFFNIQYQFLDPKKATVYIGVCGTISGILGFATALGGSWILTLVSGSGLPFSGYQVLIALSSLIGFVLFFFMHQFVKK